MIYCLLCWNTEAYCSPPSSYWLSVPMNIFASPIWCQDENKIESNQWIAIVIQERKKKDWFGIWRNLSVLIPQPLRENNAIATRRWRKREGEEEAYGKRQDWVEELGEVENKTSMTMLRRGTFIWVDFRVRDGRGMIDSGMGDDMYPFYAP